MVAWCLALHMGITYREWHILPSIDTFIIFFLLKKSYIVIGYNFDLKKRMIYIFIMTIFWQVVNSSLHFSKFYYYLLLSCLRQLGGSSPTKFYLTNYFVNLFTLLSFDFLFRSLLLPPTSLHATNTPEKPNFTGHQYIQSTF